MKILVCVKQVPESDAVVKIDAQKRWVRPERSTAFRMNRFDEFAVEEALLIRQAFPGTRVEVISVGPAGASMVVRRAIGMGADRGVHIAFENDGYKSPLTIASLVAGYARDKHYDLILTGAMAEDDMQGMVGPMLAELLFLPCASFTVYEKIASDIQTVYVEREIEGGHRESLDIQLPALLTIQGGINTPRYPSLSNMLRARQQKLETIDAKNYEQQGPREEILKIFYPEKTRSSVTLEGTPQRKANFLLQILKEKGLV